MATKDLFDYFLNRLFPLNRSLTGDANRQTLKIIQDIIPLKIIEIPTGTQVFDWIVPHEWSVHDAYIAVNGKKVVDFSVNNLHLVSYSISVQGSFEWNSIKEHIHKHPSLPDAIPYRTSYYKRTWGFCVTHEQYNILKDSNSLIDICIKTSHDNGSLTLGEFLVQGQSNKEILISSYICHPSMANDSISGVLVSSFLAKYLSCKEKPYYTYRFVFVPETIGAITYCALNQKTMQDIDMGIVVTTCGGPGAMGYKQSFDSTHIINSLAEEALSELTSNYYVYPFDIHGSDERQYSSTGFRINTVSLTKDKYYEYPEYHSSADNLDFVKPEALLDSYNAHIHFLDKLDRLVVFAPMSPNCEPMLQKYNLYPVLGGSQCPEASSHSSLDIVLWLLHKCDGKKSLQQIAHEIDCDFDLLLQTAYQLESYKLLSRI